MSEGAEPTGAQWKRHPICTSQKMTPIQDQPAPEKNTNPAIWDLVISDMKARDALGRERYGTPLQGFNGRDALVDLYQELLDAACYCRQAIFERDNAQMRQGEGVRA